ncbi:MAG: ABC transporter ATP-binding protein/permease [Defluviitaleaceae bacterium]|nr:ABC transporter ATP-binding protein/permease [Defluviitaleaceae bacterium]MCL2273922.1 ABC transporter ATP-binding protein/permease [Defluviitaleaceae bacterium]
MKKYMLAHPFIFAATVLLGIFTQGMGTAISLFIMFIIDAITAGDMAGLILAAQLGAGVVAIFFFSLLAYTRLCILYSYKTVLALKNDIFSAILGTKISDFNQSNSARHISVINNDIKMVDEKYINSILALSKDIATMVFALGAMAFLSPVNALLTLLLSSTPLVLPAIFSKKLSTANMTHMKKMAELNEKVKDFLSGFEIIKTFGIEKNIHEKFVASANESEKSRYEAGKVNVQVGTFSGTILIATQILTYLVAGYFVITGSITIGAVIAIAGLSGSIMTPIQYVSMNIANINATREVLNNLLKTTQPTEAIIRSKEADFSKGITVEKLSFSYEVQENPKENPVKKAPVIKMITPKAGQSIEDALAEHGIDMAEANVIQAKNLDNLNDILQNPPIPAPKNAALKNVSYTFNAGGKYALVGGSGSGKSTFLRVLMGYYDNYTGNVTIGANEIREIDRDNLYKSLSLMHQHVFMLDDTLHNNITLYNPYKQDEYENALQKAQLTAYAQSLPHGGKIGEGGNTLSGGERQRVAIARAMIKGSEAIFLDEATASLDNETAYEIEKSLLETPETTCIFITHRYTKSLLQKCDGILVMRNGELVETGTFDELYERKDYFYSLYTVNHA